MAVQRSGRYDMAFNHITGFSSAGPCLADLCMVVDQIQVRSLSRKSSEQNGL